MPRAIASDRVGDLHDLAIERISPAVRLRQPVEDVHQRRLAGAVLTEQRVDLARAHIEVDVVVREDTRVALRDAPHLERGRLDGRLADGLGDGHGVCASCGG